MGWSYGHNTEGREIGYGVLTTCDHHGCDEVIDRGLSYACRECHDCDEDYMGRKTCGGYYCSEHEGRHRCGDELTGEILRMPRVVETGTCLGIGGS